MTVLPLDELLALVGELDDSLGEDTARERFRRYVRERLTDIDGTLAYIDAATAMPDEQHARALQDLVNHLGGLLGFSVDHGPYLGLPGQIGYDGLWKSPTGTLLLVEVKTGETFAARRAGVARSIERLITEGKLADWQSAVGLYVVAGPDVDTSHLERLILEEPQSHALRIVSVPSLQRLARLQAEGTLSHADAVSLFRSGSPRLDPLVEVLSRAASPLTRSDPGRPTAHSAVTEPLENSDGGRVDSRSTEAPDRVPRDGERGPRASGAASGEQGKERASREERHEAGDDASTEAPRGDDGRRGGRGRGSRRAHGAGDPYGRPVCPNLAAEIEGMLHCLGEWLARGVELMFDVEVQRRPRHDDPTDG